MTPPLPPEWINDHRPALLDLFCCQGGAGMGYHQSGFKVVGVDIEDQPRYPFPFIQGDALTFVEENREWIKNTFALIHASPPCQAHSLAQRIQGREHPELIEPTREWLEIIGLPYVIENVPGAPLKNPITLCGAMFGLRTYRHRLFETSLSLSLPRHPPHVTPTTKMGRKRKPGEFAHYVGNFVGVQEAREDMEMPWASRDGLREAVPPAYTRYIGKRFLEGHA